MHIAEMHVILTRPTREEGGVQPTRGEVETRRLYTPIHDGVLACTVYTRLFPSSTH